MRESYDYVKNNTDLTETRLTAAERRPGHRRLHRPRRDARRPRQLRHHDDRTHSLYGHRLRDHQLCYRRRRPGLWTGPALSRHPGLETISGLRHSGRDSFYRRRLGGDALMYETLDAGLIFWPHPALWHDGPLLWHHHGGHYADVGRETGGCRLRTRSGQCRHWRRLHVSGFESGHFNL